MKKLICLLFLLAAFNVQAKEITVTAYGEGDDYDWAVLNAVENAVRQSSDITVEGKGLSKVDISAKVSHDTSYEASASAHGKLDVDASHREGFSVEKVKVNANEEVGAEQRGSSNESYTASFHNNSKEIPAQYKGTVSSYEVLEHVVEDGKHKVKISALIIKEDVYDAHDYKSKDLVKKSAYSLAIMPFKSSQTLTCLGKKLNMKETNAIITNLFIEKLAPSRKFNLIDRNNMDDYASEMALIEGDLTLPENKVKLKNVAAADYILVGSVDSFTASTSKDYVPMTGETNYSSTSKVKISYRILETATMEIVSAGSSEQKFSKDGAFSSCANVQDLLFGRAITEASENILTDVFPDYQPKPKAAPKKAARKAAPAKQQDYSLPLF